MTLLTGVACRDAPLKPKMTDPGTGRGAEFRIATLPVEVELAVVAKKEGRGPLFLLCKSAEVRNWF